MPIWFNLLWVTFAATSGANFIRDRHVKRTTDADEYSRLTEIGWRLGMNALRGSVEAEAEVSDHDDFHMRWYRTETRDTEGDSTRSFGIPLTSSLSQNVYVQRYWSSGVPYLNSKIVFHPVPRQLSLDLALEVSSNGYGPILYYSVSLPVDQGYHAQRQSLIPEPAQMVAYPQGVVHYSEGQSVQLVYKAKAKTELSVYAIRATLSSESTKLLDVATVSVADSSEEVIAVSHELTADDWDLTTVTLDIPALSASDARMYELLFWEEGSTVSIATSLLPSGQQSLFDSAGIHMSLQACDPQSVVSEEGDLVRFEFDRNSPFCVKCQVVNTYSEEILRGGFPVGSGPTYSVYWYDRSPDIKEGVFVVYDQTFQSYSFDGTYTCSGHGYDGSYMEREFEIVTV